MNLYIHVPFCAQRCTYCDFYTQTRQSLRSRYIDALLCEVELRSSHEPIEHIYFGGGTPSLLTPSELEQICSALRSRYTISAGGEITIECNPDDITPQYAIDLAQLGFNRASMGVQSFQAGDLKFLNRRHNAEQVYQAVEALRGAGITNLSLDLIYGLPGQTHESWSDNVRRIIRLDVPHISAYHLIYEEGTPLTRLRDAGRITEVSEQYSLDFFRILIHELRGAGYEHYEVSNFARPAMYARLNTGYWHGAHYIGLGPSAHSFDGRVRSHNVADIAAYADALLEHGRLPSESELLTEENLRHEYIMTRLRTQWGIPLGEYAEHYGLAAHDALMAAAAPHMAAGRLYISGGALRLTESGVFTSDGIILDLF